MRDFDEILNQLKSDLEADIPALLAAESLDDFAEYKIGGSKNPDETGLFVYLENGRLSVDLDRLTVIVQLQLHKVEEIDSAKYASAVSNYLLDYDSGRIGFASLDEIEVDSWPIEKNQTAFVYIVCTWFDEKDSCD
jgi:hypothetical protein